jgi:hypothetical protein
MRCASERHCGFGCSGNIEATSKGGTDLWSAGPGFQTLNRGLVGSVELSMLTCEVI